MNKVTKDEKNKVLLLCHEFLGDSYSDIALTDVEISRLITGIANKTFHVSIKDGESVSKGEIEHKDVIVRIYNSGFFKDQSKFKFNGEAAEVIILRILSEKGLAAKLLGVFPGGRVEEFIPSRVSTADDLKSVDLSKAIIRKVVNYQMQEMPVSKQPKLLDRVIEVVQNTDATIEFPPMYANAVDDCLTIVNFPIEEEYEWLARIMPIVCKKVVFSHNDLNPNNILLRDNVDNLDDQIVLIDYEMSGYFYRAYDLAYFLRMKRARLNMVNDKISFSLDEEDQSATDEILHEYLNETKKLNRSKFDPKYDNLKHLRMEIKFFNLVYAMFFIGITKNAIYESKVIFPVKQVSVLASAYKETKERAIDEYGDPSNWEQDSP